MDDEDVDAFLLGWTKNTIDTTLQVSKEPRVAFEGFVGSNDHSVKDLQTTVQQLAHVEEEVVEEEEDNEEDNEDGDMEENEEEEYDDACLWHDTFLELHNLKMEILDGGDLDMVEVAEGPLGMNSGVADVGSISCLPLPEGVGSSPRTAGSGQTLDASFHDGSNLEINQMFETKEELQTKLHEVAMHGNFEYKVVKSNKWLYVVKCINESCKWWVLGSKLPNFGYFIIQKYKGTHTCSLVGRSMSHRQATYKVIGQKFKSQYTGVSDDPTPRGIVNLACENLKVGVSYWKGWKARRYAHSLIRGSPEKSFPLLPSYCHILKLKNSRTFTCIEVDENKKFKFFYGSRRIDKGICLHTESDRFGWYLLEVHMQGNLVGHNLSR